MKMQTRLLMMATFVALAMSGSIAQDNSAGLEEDNSNVEFRKLLRRMLTECRWYMMK